MMLIQVITYVLFIFLIVQLVRNIDWFKVIKHLKFVLYGFKCQHSGRRFFAHDGKIYCQECGEAIGRHK